jgi:hypothetical protein
MPLPDEIWVHFNTPSWNVLKFPLWVRNFTQVTSLSARPNFHLTYSIPSNQIMRLALKQITTSTFIIILQFDTKYFFSYRAVAQSGSGPPRCWGFSITHNDVPQLAGLLCTSDQLSAGTSIWHHTTLTTNVHASGGNRTHHLSRRAAAELRLRPRSQWDRNTTLYICIKKGMPLYRYKLWRTRMNLTF